MDLFVVNRHGDEESESKDAETEKLAKVLEQIAKKKRIRKKQKDKQDRIKAIERTIQKRQLKRDKKARIVPVPDNQIDEFIDKNILSEVVDVPISNSTKRDNQNIKAELESFTILGGNQFSKKAKVKRVLPKWLTTPTVISTDLQNLNTKVSEVKILDKPIRKLLKANGIINFFPVQAEVIPWLLKSNQHSDIMFPRDICVSAPTGSGKTLAFALPIIQILKKFAIKKIRALVILPTQDLARQVYKTFKTYSEGTKIDVFLSTAQNLFENEQRQLVAKNEAFGYLSKVDILICTAGRLVDHLKLTEGFDLQFLEFLVIDEADRVLDSVQNDWLHHLEKHIHHIGPGKVLNQFTLESRKPPQKLLFSATLSQDPEKLQQLSLFQPKLFTSVVECALEDSKLESHLESFIGKYTTPKELTEKYVETTVDLKPLVLYKFIMEHNLKKTLIFTHSVETTHRLTILLKTMFGNEFSVYEISSQLQPKSREELIQNFSRGKIDLLICTDALSRGIDLPGVECVISYSAPKYVKTYIHRAGRTARAGKLGLAITFLHRSQLSKFKGLLKQAEKSNVEELKISEEELETLAEQYKESLQKLKETVEQEEKVDLLKNKFAKRLKPKSNDKNIKQIKLND